MGFGEETVGTTATGEDWTNVPTPVTLAGVDLVGPDSEAFAVRFVQPVGSTRSTPASTGR